jgi:hypothetical protein
MPPVPNYSGYIGGISRNVSCAVPGCMSLRVTLILHSRRYCIRKFRLVGSCFMPYFSLDELSAVGSASAIESAVSSVRKQHTFQ